MIEYALDSIDFIDRKDTVIVVGYKKEAVISALSSEYQFAVQEEQLRPYAGGGGSGAEDVHRDVRGAERKLRQRTRRAQLL